MKIVVLDGYTENPGDLSWAAQAARQRIMDITVDNVKAFIAGSPANVVNK